MSQILKQAYRVQDAVNLDAQQCKQPSSGKVPEVIAWLIERNPISPPTRWDKIADRHLTTIAGTRGHTP